VRVILALPLLDRVRLPSSLGRLGAHHLKPPPPPPPSRRRGPEPT
jgi:hypothetical protein